nr:MAG TPA: hypothetical protein [Caudoviricetes sp.]
MGLNTINRTVRQIKGKKITRVIQKLSRFIGEIG